METENEQLSPEEKVAALRGATMATSPVIDRLASLSELAALAGDVGDAEKVTIARALLFPLFGDTRRQLRLGVMERVKTLIKVTAPESKKFIIGGIVLELDEIAKSMQSSCGSRAAQETSLMWLHLAKLALVSMESGAKLDKMIAICAKLANGAFRGIVKPKVARRRSRVIGEIVVLEGVNSKLRELNAKPGDNVDLLGLVAHLVALEPSDVNLRSGMVKMIDSIVQEKKASLPYQLYAVELGSRHLAADELKGLIPVLEKQMLRSAEVATPRVCAIIRGASTTLDMSPYVRSLTTALTKVVLGTNEENKLLAHHAIKAMFGSCGDEMQLGKVADYIKAVFNGKETKITQNQQKIDVLSLFGYMGEITVESVALVKSVAISLLTIAEKETAEPVILALANALRVNTDKVQSDDIGEVFIQAALKQAKVAQSTSLICIGGVLSTHYATLITAEHVKVLKTSIDKMDKNPLAGLAALDMIVSSGGQKQFVQEYLNKKTLLVAKTQKTIIASALGLDTFATMALSLLIGGFELDEATHRALMIVITRQIMSRSRYAPFAAKLALVDGAHLVELGETFFYEAKAGHGLEDETAERTVLDTVKKITNLAILKEQPKIAENLIKCIDLDYFDTTSWRRYVLSLLGTTIEKELRMSYTEKLDLTSELSDQLAAELGTVAAVSERLCKKALNEMSTIFTNVNAIRHISQDDMDITLHDPAELWNTSVIDKHSKRLDKNSKTYEEDKWAMEQEAKINAKKGIVKLTKEQIEAKKKEMDKEAEVREKYVVLLNQFNNAIKLLNVIVTESQEMNPLQRVTPLHEAVSLLAEQLFGLLDSLVFNRAALDTLRALCRLVADEKVAPSWCNAIVSFSARLAKSAWVEDEWKKEILDVGTHRLQSLTPAKRADEALAIFCAEFSCFSMDSASAATLSTLWGVYKKLPVRQLNHLVKRLCVYLENTTDSNTIDNANDLMVAIATSLASRGLNTMHTAVNMINGLESEATECRHACLFSLNKLKPQHGIDEATIKIEDTLAHRVYTARHSQDKSLAKIAKTVMSDLDLFPADDSITRLTSDASCGVVHLQSQAAKASAEYVRAILIDLEAEEYVSPESDIRQAADQAMERLIEAYSTEYELSKPRFDTMGRAVKNIEDRHVRRLGIAAAIHAILESISSSTAEKVFNLLVPTSLNDYTPAVAGEMLHVGMKAIDVHGTSLMSAILPLFENYLQKGKSEGGADSARQSVVVLLGRLAQHLPANDKRVKPIVGQLIAALSVPSEKVQKAVATCLPALVPSIRAEVKVTINGLISLMLESKQYGERRGGAQGLAGIIKGLGLLSLKHLGILDKLQEAMLDTKSNQKREGALFGIGALSNALGRLFEPYVLKVLPILLESVGDGNFGVRDAAEEASQCVMSNLSSHGVKLVLPHLLKALESEQWRTKVGSVELLGSMAHCSPKQLSACLPQIVPYLAEVLTDSHPKVGKAGRQALGQIGNVIQNPEIKLLTPFLLDGLADPSNKITPALAQLNLTRFVHHIDAASLALIMPIIQRSFSERSAETRKLAAQIIGGMCNRHHPLCSGSDFTPYLGNIMPGLRLTLTDPVPDVRATAAKAIGNIVSITPDDNPTTSELLPWLKSLLISMSSAVDRSGAAQGLAEVMYSKGAHTLDQVMPHMLEEAGNISLPPTVRDGYCMAFIYFPVVFKQHFSGYVSKVIPALLANLADENEYLRDTALKAGKKIIQLFADTAIALLLPELEQGLLDENWRIRYSSVQLLGDLLFHITGVTGKQSSEGGTGEDNFGTSDGQKMIEKRLGSLCYNRVLAGLYMCRSDVALLVRQSALHVWKLIVYNTARSIREVLPVLIQIILANLASEYEEKRQIASRTLGDLVKKLGERILPKLMPILNQGLESDLDEQRQGVCIGLTEVIMAASKDMVIVMSQQLGPTIRTALSDQSEGVRSSAADAFEELHNKLGNQATEEIIPHLLDLLQASEDEKNRALDGLRRILASKGRAVLPAVLPKLTEKPVNTATLSFLASAAGEHLSRYVDQVIAALISALVDNKCDEATLQDCSILIEAVDDEHGASLLLDEIIESSKSDDPVTRHAAAALIKLFTEKTEAPYEEYYGVLFRELIRLFAEPEGSEILPVAWTALATMVKLFDSAELQQHLSSVRQAVSFVRKHCDSAGHLPGFGLEKKGINCILPIFKEGILNGIPDMKEATAHCLQEVIVMTSPAALKPSVIGLAGPLIRVLGDRYGPMVKCPLLATLELLLERNGAALKAFLPQLQTTFLKASHDESREVRFRGAEALGALARHHARIEPLVTDLRKSLGDNMHTPIAFETYAHALRLVMERGGQKVKAEGKEATMELMDKMMDQEEEEASQARLCAAGVMAATITQLDDPTDALETYLTMSGTPTEIASKLAVLAVVVKLRPELVMENAAVLNCLVVAAKSEEPVVVEGIILLLTYLFIHYQVHQLPNQVVTVVKKLVTIKSPEIQMKLANAMSWSQNENDAANAQLLPMIIQGVGHATMSVKQAYETCLVVCTRIRHHEYGIEPLIASLSGKEKNWLADFCQTGGKLRRLALTSPTINNPDCTLIFE